MVGNGHWVLVVEDDDDLRAGLVALLEDEGVRAEGAPNGRAALERLEPSRGELPCMIFLDLMMPEMNGDEFRRRQLGDPRLSNIPVVVLSAMHDAAITAQELRAAGSLGKPLELEAFIDAVRSHC